jgi:hypothetical protein
MAIQPCLATPECSLVRVKVGVRVKVRVRVRVCVVVRVRVRDRVGLKSTSLFLTSLR